MPTPSNRTSMGTASLPGTVATRATNPLYGKYRGRVTATNDPTMRGRIRAVVPFPFGTVETEWAEPASAPGEFNPPAVGDGVWIEFEMGDRTMPIWSGCWFRQGQASFQTVSKVLQLNDEEAKTTPEDDFTHAGFHDHKTGWYSPHRRYWRTPTGHYILFDDWQNADGSPGVGRVTIAHRSGLLIEMREEGQIEIFAGENAHLVLDSDQQQVTVQVNQTSVVLDGAAGKAVVTTDDATILAKNHVYLGDDPETGVPLQLMTQADAAAIQAQLQELKEHATTHTHKTVGVKTDVPASIVTSLPPLGDPPNLAYAPVLTEKTRGT